MLSGHPPRNRRKKLDGLIKNRPKLFLVGTLLLYGAMSKLVWYMSESEWVETTTTEMNSKHCCQNSLKSNNKPFYEKEQYKK